VSFQSTISSPFFNAVSEHYFITFLQSHFSRQWSHFSNKNSRLLQLWDSYKTEKTHAALGYKKREKERTKEEERRRQQKKQGGKQKQRGERQQKNTQRKGKITVNRPESAPQAATTSTSTKPLQRGKNIVDRGNKRNKEKKQRRNSREEEERPQQHHRPTCHQHHRQLIYPSSLS